MTAGPARKTVLAVVHAPSDYTVLLRESLLAGMRAAEAGAVDVKLRAPLDAGPADVLEADAVIIGTTENFGAMAGRTKDFFERVYYPCLERKQGLPAALYVRAGEDGQGTLDGVTRILTGLRWSLVQPPLLLRGADKEPFAAQVHELGMTVVAGLDAGIF